MYSLNYTVVHRCNSGFTQAKSLGIELGPSTVFSTNKPQPRTHARPRGIPLGIGASELLLSTATCNLKALCGKFIISGIYSKRSDDELKGKEAT